MHMAAPLYPRPVEARYCYPDDPRVAPKESFVILVSGSRDWTDVETIHAVLQRWVGRALVPVVIMHGDCPTGADRIANDWAEAKGIKVDRHPAQWEKYGKAAGPIRNTEMVRTRPRIALLFRRNHSRGTTDTLERLRAMEKVDYELYGA